MLKVKHNAEILVGDYQFSDSLRKEVLSLLKVCKTVPQETSNVKASIHTVWDWESDNIHFRNLKAFLREEIERNMKPGAMSGKSVSGGLKCKNFWGNVYEKGDYARPHCHKPWAFSFVYFVKAKWYDSPLIFIDSGKRIRPKEGRYVIFPAYLKHHVPKHRYKDTRITLSGNLVVNI